MAKRKRNTVKRSAERKTTFRAKNKSRLVLLIDIFIGLIIVLAVAFVVVYFMPKSILPSPSDSLSPDTNGGSFWGVIIGVIFPLAGILALLVMRVIVRKEDTEEEFE